MQGRKYFQSSIIELEKLFNKSSQDFAILEELEEELVNRGTKRARSLLKEIRGILGGSINQTDSTEHVEIDGDDTTVDGIDWQQLLEKTSDNIDSSLETVDITTPIENEPIDILDSWLALEVLSPQTYKKPENLIFGTSTKVKLTNGAEPWFNNEKSKKNCNLYYTVYLGAISMENATKKLLMIYQDKRIEKISNTGFAALGVILLDKNGVPVPETGLAISSFGWGYGQALKGGLNQLKHWGIVEKTLKKGLEEIFYKTDEGGQSIPVRMGDVNKAHHWLCKNSFIPNDDTTNPDFAIRVYQQFSKGEPSPPLLNSFYLDDLQRAKTSIANGESNDTLDRYLNITPPNDKFDLLQNNQSLESILEPKNTPVGRWPSKGRFPLALLQQAAVNLASKELEKEHLFSVNGPPGTGKTTLLRDIIADVIIARARKLSEYTSPDQAFTDAGKIKLGQAFIHLYSLDPTLQGYEILVASSNNNAVENISKELPQRDSIAQDLDDFSYFRTVSDALAGEKESTWGLIASALGNSSNRFAFTKKGWWDDSTGLKKYFTHYRNNPKEGEQVPLIVEQDEPPKTTEYAKQKWERAVNEFKKAIAAAENSILRAQKTYESHKEINQNLSLIKVAEAEKTELGLEILINKRALENVNTELSKTQDVHDTRKLKESKSRENKPNIFAWLFARKRWKDWKAVHSTLRDELKASSDKLEEQRIRASKLVSDIQTLNEKIRSTIASLKYYQKKNEQLDAVIVSSQDIVSESLVGQKLWSLDHQDLQKTSPNFQPSVQLLRDDVFVKAMLLHKAFIDLSEKQVRQNLGAFMSVISGKELSHDMAHLLPHLWSTFFLLTPVVSTTFASVGRMLRGLKHDSIGWLLVDEAGQSSPQEAVGAIMRAKKVVSVGDPLQIPPVVPLPSSLVEGISKHYGVDPMGWSAPFASVQSVLDQANKYGAFIHRDLSEIFIGSPLLVHRRCQEPMFSISNDLAYSGLMVHATAASQSALTSSLGSSQWFDVQGSNFHEKWCLEEGQFVLELIIKALESQSCDADIFVITPFKIVGQKMRKLVRDNSDVLLHLGITNPSDWIKNRIGTVHTFQGKEADTVIFLLGASSPGQGGARQWAASSVNILNVAVSRAKNNFYVVGSKRLWSNVGHMKLISKKLEDAS